MAPIDSSGSPMGCHRSVSGSLTGEASRIAGELRAPDEAARKSAQLLARTLVERIDVVPLPARGEVEISVRPRVDALVALALQESWEFGSEKTRWPTPPPIAFPPCPLDG